MDIGNIVKVLREWTCQLDTEIGNVYLFGSPIHRGGSTFNSKISDIDLLIEIPSNISKPIEIRNWLKKIKESKKNLEIEFLILLKKQDATKQIVSILPISENELIFDLHKSKVQSFFKSNEFLDIKTGKITTGIPNINFETVENQRIIQTIEYIQKCRNEYLKNSVSNDFNTLEYRGEDVLPKELMRNAAMVEYINKTIKKPGDDLNVNFGLTYIISKLKDNIDIDEEIELVFNELMVRSNGRGERKNGFIDSDSHLLILEILFENIIKELKLYQNNISKVEQVHTFVNNKISINEYKKIEKLNIYNEIGNVAINQEGNQMAFSQDNELFILNLTSSLPNYVGSHDENELDISKKIELKENNKDANLCSITGIIYSRDGSHIFSSDNSGLLKCWNTLSKNLTNSIEAHSDKITSIAVSTNNLFLATGCLDETIKIWELEKLITDKEIKPKYTFNKKSNIKRIHTKKGPFPHEIEEFYSIAFSNDSKYIASGDQKGLLVIREIETQKEVYRNKIHNLAIHSIDFSPSNSSLLATASDDTRIKIVNLELNSNVTLGIKQDKHQMGLNSVSFSYKGDLLVSSATDNCIKLWQVDKLELLLSYEREGGNLIDKVTFFPNKYDFTTNSIEKNISLWQINKSGNIGKTEISFD
ncbi:MAG: hypothetical protein CVU08_09690 [Bacteroidetes bacterium HGW-Bacteroidetes-3]|jgi:WD40 repeat protein/predicted nucleotidyltransferase|nr:MAG: hypothetical protein CVU08_09690 [Bacteroidetes bacterium HGW-Bacteroidetes-3]